MPEMLSDPSVERMPLQPTPLAPSPVLQAGQIANNFEFFL